MGKRSMLVGNGKSTPLKTKDQKGLHVAGKAGLAGMHRS